MPKPPQPPDDFVCPYRHNCPHLEGLSAVGVWEHRQRTSGQACHYEHQLAELYKLLDAERDKNARTDAELNQLKARYQALHQSQFKARKQPPPDPPQPDSKSKKRGAPVGHPPWNRRKPVRIDRTIVVPAPERCPHCGGGNLRPVDVTTEHIQEDIVLEPRTIAVCYEHRQSYCPCCRRNVHSDGPGELPGSYIGPAAKSAAVYLRHDLDIPNRKISRFFKEFFGLSFVPASAYGFERQAVRRGRPLYEDLGQKIQALSVVHADETSWRHDGKNFWAWYAGDDNLAFFRLDPRRTSEAAQRLLGERFGGTLVADAYASYNGVKPKARQSCLAHIKTKAETLQKELGLLEPPSTDPRAVQFCQDIQGWVHDACQAHDKLRRKPWRAKTAKRIEQTLRARLRRLCRKLLNHPRTEAFRKRLTGTEQRNLLTCFRHPGVPPTNNQAERSLRPLVIMRKVVLCTRSEKGLENHGILRSLHETARRQGKDPRRFFHDLFTLDTAAAQAALYRNPMKMHGGRPLRC